MNTLKNIALCVLITIIASPVAAILINFIIDLSIWLEYFISSISFIFVGNKAYSDIGWLIISAAIIKFLVPFYGAYTILEFGDGSKYTWPPAISFFLIAMFLAVQNVYFYMNIISSN